MTQFEKYQTTRLLMMNPQEVLETANHLLRYIKDLNKRSDRILS
jgi:hypothetical protein